MMYFWVLICTFKGSNISSNSNGAYSNTNTKPNGFINEGIIYLQTQTSFLKSVKTSHYITFFLGSFILCYRLRFFLQNKRKKYVKQSRISYIIYNSGTAGSIFMIFVVLDVRKKCQVIVTRYNPFETSGNRRH